MALAISGAAPALFVPDPLKRRTTRVCLLAAFIAAASGIDLYLTLTHLRTVGLIEANPIARLLIAQNCVWLLSGWKLLSVALALTIFVVNARRRACEAAAWFCAGVMVWLMLQWIGYSQQIGALTPVLHQLAQTDGTNWVTMH